MSVLRKTHSGYGVSGSDGFYKQYYPAGSEYSTWEDWNGGLIHYFSEEPIVSSEEINWKETARSVVALPTFANYPLSDPDLFETWQDWVSDFNLVITRTNV